MNAVLVFIPIIVVTFIFFLLLGSKKPNRMMKSKSASALFRINRSTHYKIVVAFIALLLVLTITIEIMEPQMQKTTPAQTVDADFSNMIESLDGQIFNRETIDPSIILEKRTHFAGKTLTIHRNDELFDRPYIYIERKPDNDDTIEEFLYKPILIVDDLNFSDKVNVTKPKWTEDTVTFRKVLQTNIERINFEDASMLKQLTTMRFQPSISMGYGSMSSLPVVHLKVPKDLKIIAEDEDELIFIDEFD